MYEITDEQINKAWYGSWHDGVNKRLEIMNALLKYAGGYISGYTITSICKELELLTPKSTRNNPILSKYGKRVLYHMVAKYIKAKEQVQ